MKHSLFITIAYCISLTALITACTSEKVYSPKPRMYPKIEYPKNHDYVEFEVDYCDFSFDQPNYTQVVQSNKFFEKLSSHPCWFDLDIPIFNGQIHFSYYPISHRDSLAKFVNDAFKMANKHVSKANNINEINIEKDNVAGVLFDIQGPVASQVQFFLTDEKSHFLRASLYFNSTVNADSIAPIVSFVRKDINQIIDSFVWHDEK